MAPIHITPKTDHKFAPIAMLLACRSLALALLMSTPVIAQTAKDTVRWDDRAGQWVYTLFNPADLTRFKEVRYTPRTLIEPIVKSKVQWDKDQYQYSYRVKNGAAARQPISSISVLAPKWEAQAITHAPSQTNMTWAQIQSKARAEVAAEEAFVAKTIYSPNRWQPFLNVNRPTRVVFGWLADSQKSYAGIAPGTAQGSFSVLRPELPGAGWMELQGDTPDMYNAPTLPQSGAVAGKVAEMLADDSLYVPVLVPAIVLPNPYSGAELARRLKAHVAAWHDAGLMDSDSLAAVNLKLDVLISALNVNDKKVARAAGQAITDEARKHHTGLDDANTNDDEQTQDTRSSKPLSVRGGQEDMSQANPPMQHVAARALAFNVRYLMERMEAKR